MLSSPREHHGYIYGGVRRVRGQGQQEPPLSLLQQPHRQSRRERAATATTATPALPPPSPSPPSSRGITRAPPSPPRPHWQEYLRRAAAAEQRGQQHTRTPAQQDEGAQEAEAQDGPR